MNRLTKLAPYGVGLLAIVGVLAAPQAAQAHDGGITATCTSLSANLSNYPAGSTIGGTLDGADLGTSTFGPSFSQTATLDPAVAHSWSITVVSGDGDPRYSFTSAGASDPACIPVVEEPPVVTPPVEPPVVVPPVEPPTEEPPVVTPPAPVIEPRIQDYITCLGGAFVLDNTGSDQDVLYSVNGFEFLVPAGEAVHTDATLPFIQPNTALGAPYVITAGDERWTFPSAGNCEVVPPVTDEPTEEPTVPAEPTTPVTEPVTPVVDESPAPVAPLVTAEDDAPVQVKAAAIKAPTEDGSLAYTGTDTTGTWIAALSALGLAMLGLLALFIARARQIKAQATEGDAQ